MDINLEEIANITEKKEDFEEVFNKVFSNQNINISFDNTSNISTYMESNEEQSIKENQKKTEENCEEKYQNKKGRKTNKKNTKFHDKTEKGNIRSKIKNKYHKFIIDFLNEQIRKINNGRQKVKFRTIDYNITNIRNKKENRNLLQIKIKDLFDYNISNKYIGKPKEQNKKTLDKTYFELKYYYEMTYEDFFTNYFLIKNHPKEYSNKIVFFYDFLEKEKQKELNRINLLYGDDESEKQKQKIRNKNYINTLIDTGKNYITFYKNVKKIDFNNKRIVNSIIFSTSETFE